MGSGPSGAAGPVEEEPSTHPDPPKVKKVVRIQPYTKPVEAVVAKPEPVITNTAMKVVNKSPVVPVKLRDDVVKDPVPHTESNYPVAKVSSSCQHHMFTSKYFTQIDQRAREAPKDLVTDYHKLLTYLLDDYKSEVQKVRSIFIWMAEQKIPTSDYSKVADRDTPEGFMKRVKDDRATMADFFAVLCRIADIKCVIVEGYAKSVDYKVGCDAETTKMFVNLWNAVYCDGVWRLVFPRWACSGMANFSPKGYTLLESKDLFRHLSSHPGKGALKNQPKTEPTIESQINEDFFFPDPEVFIYRAFPKDPRWQLLTRPWDMSKFSDVPNCHHAFFEEELRVESKFTGRLMSKDGECSVKISCKKPDHLVLDYHIYYDKEESKKEFKDSDQMTRYVMINRENNAWECIMRFPESGVYILQIVGGRRDPDTGDRTEGSICEFRIDCKKPKIYCRPFPFNPGSVGYGPSLETKAAGVDALSHKSAVVKMHVRERTEFRFRLASELLVKLKLIHETKSDLELENNIATDYNRGVLYVKVTLTEGGEYVLAMYIDRGENNMQNVCNYLLTSESRNRKQKLYDTPIEKKLRESILRSAQADGSKNLKELKNDIAKFNKLDLVDKGELDIAHDALEYKQALQGLENAIKRRNLPILKKAIQEASTSKFKDQLVQVLQDAEYLQAHLEDQHACNSHIDHDVLKLEQATITEIMTYKDPKPIVVDLMAAVLLVLGEKESHVQYWEDVQLLLRKKEQESLVRKLGRFKPENIPDDVADKVRAKLAAYKETDARLVSAALGTFYVWLRDTCKVIDQPDNMEIEETNNVVSTDFAGNIETT